MSIEQELEHYKATPLNPEWNEGQRFGFTIGSCDWAAEEQLMKYETFLIGKTQSGDGFGFEPNYMPSSLFDFQGDLVDWALRKGRAAIFADCGLGKTLMQLVWAENVVRHTNKPVLILTPLAVGAQTIREGEKFGMECTAGFKWDKSTVGIIITNYERLHHFDAEQFAGVVCDESSILKSFDGTRRSQITEFMRTRPYRLLCTATAAPNDYIELGTSSEALGGLGHIDMLQRFFKNDQNTVQPMRKHIRGTNFQDPPPMNEKWRFKGHAEIPFWRWVCSWARAVRKPSDLGYSDGSFVLPPLTEEHHLVSALTLPDGCLFATPAIGLKEQREERKRMLGERCDMVGQLVSTGKPALVWCHTNEEGDRLEKLLPNCVQVSGKDSDEEKEEKFLAFTSGQAKDLVTKHKIGAWGLNFQHCDHVVSFVSHSFEQYYQGVRRCWRFGQPNPVKSDIVTTEGEQSVMINLQRKSKAADEMFSRLVTEMNHAMHLDRTTKFSKKETLPSWLLERAD